MEITKADTFVQFFASDVSECILLNIVLEISANVIVSTAIISRLHITIINTLQLSQLTSVQVAFKLILLEQHT